MQTKVLLIPEKSDIERNAVAEAWAQQGGIVKPIGKFWVKPVIESASFAIYGNDTFALVLAQVMDVQLLTPQDVLISKLSVIWTKRGVRIISEADLVHLVFPLFLKPTTPKLFKAAVYDSLDDFHHEVGFSSLPKSLICSEVLAIEAEVRAFIFQRTIADLAYYEGQGNVEEAQVFIEAFLKEQSADLPLTYVMDLGFNQDLGWFVIEFNACWGAGLNGCDPAKVISCIDAATVIKN